MDRIDTHLGNEDFEGRTAERDNVMETLRLNGYPKGFVRQVQERKRRAQRDPPAQKEEPTERRWLSVPYTQGLSESIARILRPLGIDVAHEQPPGSGQCVVESKTRYQHQSGKESFTPLNVVITQLCILGRLEERWKIV